jgi:branched-chain amino acid transport system substrate-binding protein
LINTARICAYAGLVAGGLISAGALADEPGVTATEITIGVFNPLSGPLSAFGYDPAYAAKMWYDDINKKGGIHGRKIRVIMSDDKCETNETLSIIKHFVAVDRVFLINGGACTAGAQAAKEYVTREKVPFIAMNAGADAGVFPPARYFFAGSVGTQTASGGALIEFVAKALKAKSVALLVEDDDIGGANLRGAKAIAAEDGIKLVAVERIPPQATDLTAAILTVRAAHPDVIVQLLYPAVAVMSTQKYGEFGLQQPLVAGVQSVPDPQTFAKNVDNSAALAHFYYATPLLPAEQLKKWNDMYATAYPNRQSGPWVPFGLPAAMAITRALDKAGANLTRERFIDALEATQFDTGVLVGATAYSAVRHDGSRALAFNKFDGTTTQRMPGIYTWDGSVSN